MRSLRLLALCLLALSAPAVAVAAHDGPGGRQPDADLAATEKRIYAEDRELRCAGIHVTGTYVTDHLLRVEVITRRRDASEYMRARYGDHIRVKVIASRLSRVTPTRWDSYRMLRGARRVRIYWTTNTVYEVVRITVGGSSDRVLITVYERKPNGPHSQAAKTEAATVRLGRRLGRRTVIDGATGHRRPAVRRPRFP